MKKRFELTSPNKEPQRVLEAVKNEIRKYIKREKRKPLPQDMDIWNIACKFSKEEEELQEILFKDITTCLDEASALNTKSINIELISNAVKREVKKVEEETLTEKIIETQTTQKTE